MIQWSSFILGLSLAGLSMVMLPGIGWVHHLAPVVFLASLLSYFELRKSLVIVGLGCSILLELLGGIHLGGLSVPFILGAFIRYLLGNLVDIRAGEKEVSLPSALMSIIIGVLLVPVMWYGQVVFNVMLFNEPFGWKSGSIFLSLSFWMLHVLLFILFFLVFRSTRQTRKL